MPTKKPKISIYVPEETRQVIAVIAAARNTSMNELINQILADWAAGHAEAVKTVTMNLEK